LAQAREWLLMSRTTPWTSLRWAAVAGLAVAVGALSWDLLDLGPTSAESTPGPSTDPVASITSDGTIGTASPTTDDTSPSPTPSSTLPVATDEGPPQPPDEAHGLTVLAADAVVRFYYAEAQNYLKATGDGTAVRKLNDPACVPCRQTVAFLTARNAANQMLVGDFWWRDVDVRGVRLTGPASAVVDVNARTGRHATRGAAPITYPGGVAYIKVSLIARGDQWLIFDLEAR
jgi:Family of unknown function (DUF6318)